MKLWQGFGLAWNMLTIVPLFKIHHFFEGINGYSGMFYPLVGFLLGTVLWAVSWILTPYMPSVHLHVIVFVLWVLLSGALHLDGLSDTIDGLFVKKSRALEVMRDPHVGAMGMIFTLLFILLKLSSVIFMDALYLLPMVLLSSRLNSVLAIYLFPYIGGGMGTLVKQELQRKHLIVALIYGVLLSLVFSSFLMLLFSFVLLGIMAKFFMHRMGGLSGDMYGFIIEITELFLLNFLLISHFL